ncbi:type II toxin-antitoxin system RelE/ParE family toxin [Sphingomonas hylomeconis]|uniref:Type II toxin-antitoxin system RelE/ParE family toxin n=1 Tax=Sphingomonas hylomeconis TaxID=1395958 RepID=A0ABV7SYP9_9SPHN|nr:type II toxin-antitoxin system RelE/ParE family toxin [Sphingomonas hylomeconis]
MAGYRLSTAAADDLVAIFLEGVSEFGLAQADRYHAGLEKVFAFLGEYPRAARLRLEIRPPVRAYPHKAHLIVYELDADDGVLILRVRHAREDWQHLADEP